MNSLEISLRVSRYNQHAVAFYFEGRYFQNYDQARQFEKLVQTEASKAGITVDYSAFDCIHSDPCSLQNKAPLTEDQALDMAMKVAEAMGVELILR